MSKKHCASVPCYFFRVQPFETITFIKRNSFEIGIDCQESESRTTNFFFLAILKNHHHFTSHTTVSVL